jgi:hypothetical protein
VNVRVRALIGIAAVGLLGLPATGSATTRARIEPPTTMSSFALDGSDGFFIEVEARSSGARTAPKVTVEAVKERYKVERVGIAYSATGRWLGDGGFAAKLPGVGRIAVHFEETRRHRVRVIDNCQGPPMRLRKGDYRGTIRFRGDRGFTTLHARTASGQVRETFRQTCHETVAEPGVEEEPLGPYPPSLRAAGPVEGGSAYFYAAGPPAAEPPVSSGGIPTVAFEARYLTRRPGLDLRAITYLGTGSYTFHVPGWPGGPLTDAIAEPPKPFTGKGVFHLESPTTSSWTGGLAIDFPGLGRVPLTGPGFGSELCENLTCGGAPPPLSARGAA